MSVFNLALDLHIAAGTLALAAGPIPILTKKGGGIHRAAGSVFSVAIICLSASALVLSVIVHSTLLLTIAVLTGFLIFCGLRAPALRRGARPNRLDDCACLLTAGFGVWLLWLGAGSSDATSLFFGIGSLLLAGRQWQLQHAPRPDWILAHIAGMGGAYVAAVTAFLVVNVDFLPRSVVFIVPPLLGALLITWASAKQARLKPAA